MLASLWVKDSRTRIISEATVWISCCAIKLIIYSSHFPSCFHIFVGIDTLGDITIYLHQLDKTAIFNLGLVLGLAYNRLKAMTDSPSFLPDMLAGWLQRVDHVLRIGFPTWTRLVEALRDPRVGQNGLATKIEQDKLKAFQLITGH